MAKCKRYILNWLTLGKKGIDTSDATATASDILEGKTAYVDGQKITGDYIPLDTSDADATASDILQGKTAYANGEKIIGTLISKNANINTQITNTSVGFSYYIEEIPTLTIISDLEVSLASFFANLQIKKLPNINNFSLVTSIMQICDNCSNLEDVPIYDTSNVQYFTNCFRNCKSLTDNSLDNILQMCINATSFTGSKVLSTFFGFASQRPRNWDNIPNLPHYQDFLDAGWTLT